VLNLLDPEGLRMPTFYIYDLYDERLKENKEEKERTKQDTQRER